MGLGRVYEVTGLSQRWIENGHIYSALTSVRPAPAAPNLTREEFAGPQITATPAPRAQTRLSLRDPENARTSTFLPAGQNQNPGAGRWVGES